MLDRVFDIAEGELRIAVAGPAQRLLNERCPVASLCEPGIVETRAIIVRDVAERRREAVVELGAKKFLRAARVEKIEERISKVRLISR